MVWIQYLLRFGHIEPSRNNLFLLGLGCTPLGKKASPEKFSSTYAPGGSDGHLELPSVIFGSQLGPHWDGKFHPNLQMCAPFAHNLGNLCGGCVVYSQNACFLSFLGWFRDSYRSYNLSNQYDTLPKAHPFAWHSLTQR